MSSKLKGRGDCLPVAREVAWRQAARRWRPIPTRKPSELSILSDALYRVHAPPGKERKPFPPSLEGIPQTPTPSLDLVWPTWAPKDTTLHRTFKTRLKTNLLKNHLT